MIKRNLKITLVLLLYIIVVLTTGCQTAQDVQLSPTLIKPTNTIELTSTPTSIPPSETSSPTLTETHTPTPTDSLTPTLTPSNTATETPTETTTPTPTKVTGYVPDNAIVIYLTHIGTGGPIACGDSLVAIMTGYVRTGNIETDIALAVDTLFSIAHPMRSL